MPRSIPRMGSGLLLSFAGEGSFVMLVELGDDSI